MIAPPLWDGRLQQVVEMGLLALLINVGILLALLMLWKVMPPS